MKHKPSSWPMHIMKKEMTAVLPEDWRKAGLQRLRSLVFAAGIIGVCSGVFGFTTPSTVQAQLLDPHVGISLKAGTTGAGIDITKSIFPDVNLRIGYNRFQFSHSLTESGIRYDGDLHLETVPVFLDWHIFSGGFRLSTGVLYNNNSIDLESRATGTVVVGGTSFTPAQLGTLNGKVEMGNSFAPYLGIGWGNAVAQDQRWGVAVDLGVFYQGKPDVTLTQSGGLATVTAADLAQEEQSLEDDLDAFQFYPVATVGLFFRF